VTDGANLTFNSGSVEVDSKNTSGRYLFYVVGNGSTLTINGGNFDFNKTQNQKRAYIYAGDGTTVYVKGGTFGKASTRSGYTAGILGTGDVIITGGTFGFDPSNWVATGYQAMKVGTNWVVVAEDVTDVVFSADELTNAIANATDGDIIALGSDITADVTALQVADVDVIIDGYGHTVSSTIYLEGQARYNGAETLTFRNINFVTDSDTAFDFISANSTESAKRYAHNVTVENCTFTATGAGDVVGLRLRQTYNITVKESTFTGMHSVLWGTGISGITVDTVTATNCKNGMSFGTSNGIVVNNCNIEATGEYGYGIRVDASGAYTLSVENSNITAAAPVLLRKATGAYAATLNGNTLTTTGDYQVIVTAGDFEEDVALTAPTGAYTLNGADGLSVYVG
ncbi:MAG: right-handed parallel beta-helix repeat-containing protein, partial [Clostridia bacterium]|nr:right-handed parallel beta-helix repeat-containing protein [Clostridia bacterium]MBQ8742217.1 right-handed parallel beta-helix repeat-containing protein [Clostridia bacterium]